VIDIRPVLDVALALLPQAMDSTRARVQIVATGLQESQLTHRRQLVGNPPRPVGPAKGLWQFERGGGCKGVVSHPASRYWMRGVCDALDVDFTATAIWNAIESNDVLACAAARLLLFTDPKPLPFLADEREAWRLYMRTWRPGKPRKGTWAGVYSQALQYAT
jgi:hypothetical protein